VRAVYELCGGGTLPTMLHRHFEGSKSDAEIARARLQYIEVILAAIARRDELLRVISETFERTDARVQVADLLSTSLESADGVLDLRLVRMTRGEIERLRDERTALVALLANCGS
jgi:DNA gyrase/topoisomerase IV subunit A